MPLVPMVVEQTARGERSFDIYSRLLAQQYPDASQAVEQYRTNPQMRRQMEAAVLEDQVVDWLLERARVTDKSSSFKEIMKFGA